MESTVAREASSHLQVPVGSTAKGGALLSLHFGALGHISSLLSVSWLPRLEARLLKRYPSIWVRDSSSL